MCPNISVPDLYGVSNSIQIRGMYIIFILSENFVSKECLESKRLFVKLESGLTYVILSLEVV